MTGFPRGMQIGPYEILSLLGAGGMGEVYVANDTRLGRQVAIKALPEHLASDPDRLGRFEREARTLASLNHPNVAGIYGVEEQDGRKYLVLEYVEGETLAERLDRGAMPVDEALEVCTQIAAGVEAAHEAGVIHRDLKPANVKITPDGKVKVLDFGLAKVAEGASSSSSHQAETVTSPAYQRHSPTMPGVILGTAAYMSPEQARGRSIDKRTDIWSFGVVLYECLTGHRPFEGDTTSDLIARILEREPDWSRVPDPTPPLAQLVLRRCLVKDLRRRLRDIGVARIDLESALGDPTTSGILLARGALADVRTRRRWGRAAAVGAVGAVMAIIIGGLVGFGLRDALFDGEARPVIRFSIQFPPHKDMKLGQNEDISLTIDRAGTMLAYSAYVDGTERIFVRPLASASARPVPGTDGGRSAAFSPDGRWLAFISGNKIKKAPVGGGPPLTLCEAAAMSIAWVDEGQILFTAGSGHSIQRVSENGGSPEVLAISDRRGRSDPGREQLVLGFNNIEAIPGASYALVDVWDGVTIEDYDIVAVSLEDGSVRNVVRNGTQPQFIAPDRLVFHREGSLFSVPFDSSHGEVTGQGRLVLEGVRTSHWADGAHFVVSADGTLAFVPGARHGPGRRLIRVDAEGHAEALMGKPDALVGGVRVSPDGSAVTALTLRRKLNLWTFDLHRRSLTLVTSVGEMYSPVWLPDGKELIYKKLAPNEPAVIRRSLHTADPGRSLATENAGDLYPTSVSRDGKILLMTHENATAGQRSNIVFMRLDEESPPQPLVATSANEEGAVFSPAGRWFAYTSDETGRFQVYVRTFPDQGERWQISTDGGFLPRWSPAGEKLYFLHQNALHACTVSTESGFAAGPPKKLFDTPGIASLDAWGVYDVLSDGSFVMVEPAEWEKARPRIEVVVNWGSEWKK